MMTGARLSFNFNYAFALKCAEETKMVGMRFDGECGGEKSKGEKIVKIKGLSQFTRMNEAIHTYYAQIHHHFPLTIKSMYKLLM